MEQKEAKQKKQSIRDFLSLLLLKSSVRDTPVEKIEKVKNAYETYISSPDLYSLKKLQWMIEKTGVVLKKNPIQDILLSKKYLDSKVEFSKDGKTITLTTENFGVDLYDYQKELNKMNKGSREKIIHMLLENLEEVLNDLHDDGYVHLDVSFGNIIVNPETYDVKLIDFETALKDTTKLSNIQKCKGIGTRYFMYPPLDSNEEYTLYHADWWSLGITIMTLLCQKQIEVPFLKKGATEIERLKFRSKLAVAVSSTFVNILYGLFTKHL
jgi:serine/threonine protein kinase